VRDVTQWDEYTGRLEAVNEVEVRAQVTGQIESVNFTEGALVKQGDLLLTIDSRIFQARLDSAKAQVSQAQATLQQKQATLKLAQNDLARGEQAARTGGIAAEELDTRRVTVEQDQADIAVANAAISAAQAAVESAQLNLGWCKVTAPIDGRVSNRRLTVGNMISTDLTTANVITTIASVDPIYCTAGIDEAAAYKYEKMASEKGPAAKMPCYMELDKETGFPHAGMIDFTDNHVDPATATQIYRGVFPNPDGSLMPGSHAELRLMGGQLKSALLVIDDAIGSDQDKKYLYVLHPDNSFERRIVTVGPLEGQLRVVTSNLKPDELVLVNGTVSLMMMPPGVKLDATITPMPEQRLYGAAASPAATATSGAADAPATSQKGTEAGK
jgi:RND family efflux transporter MFP subunit